MSLSHPSLAVHQITRRETTCMTDRLVDAGAGAPGTSRLARLAEVGLALRRLLANGHGGLRILGMSSVVALTFVVPTGALAAGSLGARHFERVSPADKGDGDIIAEGESIIASKSGDGVAFASRTQFGDVIGSGVAGRTQYLARRAGDGWLTHSITPTPRPEPKQIAGGYTRFDVFSDDLSTALGWGYDLPASTDDTPDRENFYVQDTASGALRPLSVSQIPGAVLSPFMFFTDRVWGVSADVRHVAFLLDSPLLPDAALGVNNAYKWDDGVLTLAGRLPDGSVPPGGSTVGPENDRGSMSADGSRLAFSAPADGSAPAQLYLHIDGGPSVWVSQPEPEGSGLSDPTGVLFEGMTPDGKNVFFVSDTPLLAGDTAPGPDLYRWSDSADPAHDANLTLITNNGQALNDVSPYGGSLVGMSDDGRRVYVHKIAGGLTLWEDGVTSVVDGSVLRSGRISDPNGLLTLAAWGPGYGRVSPDGNWLAYIDFTDSRMYLYDRRAGTRTCVSCPGDASLVPRVTATGRVYNAGFRPRFLTPDGRLFFTSTGGLVPEDTNGVADVYEYDGPTRTLRLVSSGMGKDPSEFADASESGDDVFFVTRARLVSGDRDDYVDLYDARVGPAPSEPPADDTRPCEGDGCQAPPAVVPGDVVSGSASARGSVFLAPVRAHLTVGSRAAFRAASGSLKVRLQPGGRLAWTGIGLWAGSVSRKSAGSVTVRLRLSAAAARQLRRARRYVTTRASGLGCPRGGADNREGPGHVYGPGDQEGTLSDDQAHHHGGQAVAQPVAGRPAECRRGRARASAAGPAIGVKTLFPDYVTPGKPLLALLEVRNVGDAPMTGSVTLHYRFPSGLSFVDAAPNSAPAADCTGSGQDVTCVIDVDGMPPGRGLRYDGLSMVDPAAAGTLTGQVDLSGGGASDPVIAPFSMTVGPIGPFAIKSFGLDIADNLGVQPRQAGTAPAEMTTAAELWSAATLVFGVPVQNFTFLSAPESFRDVIVHVPPGSWATRRPRRCAAPSPSCDPAVDIPGSSVRSARATARSAMSSSTRATSSRCSTWCRRRARRPSSGSTTRAWSSTCARRCAQRQRDRHHHRQGPELDPRPQVRGHLVGPAVRRRPRQPALGMYARHVRRRRHGVSVAGAQGPFPAYADLMLGRATAVDDRHRHLPAPGHVPFQGRNHASGQGCDLNPFDPASRLRRRPKRHTPPAASMPRSPCPRTSRPTAWPRPTSRPPRSRCRRG